MGIYRVEARMEVQAHRALISSISRKNLGTTFQILKDINIDLFPDI
jgi:hypothetical protein